MAHIRRRKPGTAPDRHRPRPRALSLVAGRTEHRLSRTRRAHGERAGGSGGETRLDPGRRSAAPVPPVDTRYRLAQLAAYRRRRPRPYGLAPVAHPTTFLRARRPPHA